MTVAACGHTIDLWFTSTHIICKNCFEKQGFRYNRNSYTDCDRTRIRGVDGASSPIRRAA